MARESNTKYWVWGLISVPFILLIGVWVLFYVLSVKHPVEYVPLDTDTSEVSP